MRQSSTEAQLLEKQEEQMIARIQAKAAPALLSQIEDYARHLEQTGFGPGDREIRRRPVPGLLFERERNRFK